MKNSCWRTMVHNTRRRGAMFLWFTMVAMPMILVAGTFATDFASAVLAKEETGALADAAATAGAWQINTSGTTPSLKCGTTSTSVESIARQFVTDNASLVLKSAQLDGIPQVTCNSAANSVSVTIRYSQSPGPFYSVLGTLLSFQTEDAESSVTRTAIVCVPGEAPTIGGSCTRPDSIFG